MRRLIKKAPAFAEAYNQRAILYFRAGEYQKAIADCETALKLNPDLADGYYRLGQAYVRTGEKDRAQAQFEIYQKVRAQHMADLDKQRAEVRQFVYSAKNSPAAKQ